MRISLIAILVVLALLLTGYVLFRSQQELSDEQETTDSIKKKINNQLALAGVAVLLIGALMGVIIPWLLNPSTNNKGTETTGIPTDALTETSAQESAGTTQKESITIPTQTPPPDPTSNNVVRFATACGNKTVADTGIGTSLYRTW